MNSFISFISQTWAWYVAGPIIATTMFLLLFFGKSLGISSNLRNICAMLGAGKKCNFFDYDWKKQTWNMVFALGLVIGGYLSSTFLTSTHSIELSQATLHDLHALGIKDAGESLNPQMIFSFEQLLTFKGIVFMVVGGFLIGFGTRYAGGCTSGHAISGLSNLQLPSLIAVIGFFIGGLITTYFLIPILLK